MIAAHRWLRRAPAGAVLAAVAVTAGDWLLTPLSAARKPATFELRAPTGSAAKRRVFVLFHGLWDGPDRFEWLPDFLAPHGHVLLVSSGANDQHTPAQALGFLRSRGLMDREIHVVGFSKGSLLAVLFARLLITQGQPPASLIVACGPGSPSAVIWPHSYLRALVHVLPAGPVANRMWHLYWGRQRRQATARGSSIDALHAAWCESTHIGAILTGARLLSRGVRLVDGEFAGILHRVLIEQSVDPFIAPSKGWWARAMGTLTTHVLVPTAGHGDFGGARAHYESVWRAILTPTPA